MLVHLENESITGVLNALQLALATVTKWIKHFAYLPDAFEIRLIRNVNRIENSFSENLSIQKLESPI